MKSIPSKFSFFPMLGILLAVAACSGMSPGGGAPGEMGGPVGGGNSLDAGGGQAPGLGGSPGDSPLGGGGSGGEAVPSTQQSTDSIGGGCARFYQVKVKVLHNGAEESCTAMTYRIHGGGDVIADNSGGVYAPEEQDGDPKITVTLGYPVTRTASCVAGRWETSEPIFYRAVCGHYDMSAVASWQRDGKSHVSNTYQGAPVPNENNDPIPIELTIDLGYDSNLHYQPSEDAVNAVY